MRLENKKAIVTGGAGGIGRATALAFAAEGAAVAVVDLREDAALAVVEEIRAAGGTAVWASFGLLFLLAYPYDSRLLSPVVFLAATPYFLAMGSDLRDCGHRFTDIFRIYGFNLILLPVNLAGVIKSMQQAITGEKIPFVRTPKVQNRTAAPAIYVLVPYLIIAFSVLTLVRDVYAQNWGNALFAAFNAVLAAYATWMYIGVRNSLVDIWLGIVNWLYVDKKAPKTSTSYVVDPNKPVDWSSILYHGDRRLNRDLRSKGDRRRRVGAR